MLDHNFELTLWQGHAVITVPMTSDEDVPTAVLDLNLSSRSSLVKSKILERHPEVIVCIIVGQRLGCQLRPRHRVACDLALSASAVEDRKAFIFLHTYACYHYPHEDKLHCTGGGR